MSIGTKIANKRKEAGLTQEKLAEQLNVTRQTLSKWESNLSSPDVDTLKKMAEIFHCAVTDLLDDEDKAPTGEPANPPSQNEIPANPPSKAPHILGILGIIFGALGSVAGLVLALIGKKKSVLPEDKKLNKIGVLVSVLGLIFWTIAGSLSGYFLMKRYWESIPQSESSSSTPLSTGSVSDKYWTVHFQNEDGSDLGRYEVKDGTLAHYDGVIPEKSQNPQNGDLYTFTGWTPDINQPVYHDTIFMALYKATSVSYLVKFLNDDGTVLKQETVPYGGYATVPTQVPTKADDDNYTYVFGFWSPDPADRIYRDTTFLPFFTTYPKSTSSTIISLAF